MLLFLCSRVKKAQSDKKKLNGNTKKQAVYFQDIGYTEMEDYNNQL